MKRLIIITALACEAQPIIRSLDLKPDRSSSTAQQFQTFSSSNVVVGISGIGALRSAVCTAALLSLYSVDQASTIIANVGLAGTSAKTASIGTPVLVHKVTDIPTGRRFYPDILIRHPWVEVALETHSHPVLLPPLSGTIVDMEGSGFMQAATSFLPPSRIAIVKIISDDCTDIRFSADFAKGLVEVHSSAIADYLFSLGSTLPAPYVLNGDERAVVDRLSSHLGLSVTQQETLHRTALAAYARGHFLIAELSPFLEKPISARHDRNATFRTVVSTLTQDLAKL